VNPVGPRGVYDEAKRAAETFVMAYHNAHGLDTRIARIFNTFGPRMRRNDGRAAPAFITQALASEPMTVFGDGSQTRSLCYIDDLVDGIERLLFSNHHQPVNLGNPGELTMLELAEMIRGLVGSSSPIVHQGLPVDDPRRRRPDISTAREVLGWEPTITLEEGLRRTIAWWVERGPHARVSMPPATPLPRAAVEPAAERGPRPRPAGNGGSGGGAPGGGASAAVAAGTASLER
jgi:dTDP-glucose 4,6-dehydratase